MSRVSGAREKVERAAVDLFATNGVDGVSIADIAVAAGVSQGALYRHYASKEELAWAMFSSGYLRMGQELEAMRAEVARFRPGDVAGIAPRAWLVWSPVLSRPTTSP